jgi:predicted amidophosphoribosyltransferase
MTVGLTHWIKCEKCGKGMDYHASTCEHCGYEYSENELIPLKRECNRKGMSGAIFAAILFPLIIYCAYKYFGSS